jgi:AcrR family transcriptional regulator
MAGPVKSATGRRSTYRQEQAAATRARIAAAARHLFVAEGYHAATVEAIAAGAGVAVRTVYSIFGSKREILSAICEQWLEDARVRPTIAAALAEPDPGRRLRLGAYWLRSLYERGFDVVRLFDAATTEDAETRAMLRTKLDGRNQAQDMLIASLADHLVVPLVAAQAVFRALAAPGIYLELVVDSGWGLDDFEEWVAQSLCQQLLGRAAPERGTPWPPQLPEAP